MKDQLKNVSPAQAAAEPLYFIHWASRADDLKRVHQTALSQEPRLPFGGLKFMLGKEIWVARGFKVLSQPSLTYPGTLLALTEGELQITTGTQVVALSDIVSVEGQSWSISALSKRYQLTKGYQLASPEVPFLKKLEKTLLEYAAYEPFWAEALKEAKSMGPLYLNFKDSKPEEGSVISLSQWEAASLKDQVDSLCDQPAIALKPSLLVTLALVCLYRFGNYQNFSLKLSNRTLLQHQSDFMGIFASAVPMVTHFEPDMIFMDAYQKIDKLIHQLEENKSYLSDLSSRSAQLSPALKEPGLSVSVQDPALFKLPATEMLAIVINESGTQMGVFIRKNALPASLTMLLLKLPDHVKTLLESLCIDASPSLRTLPLLNKQERNTVLNEWNKTKVALPQDKPIQAFFEAQVLKTPHHTAVVYEGNALTYEELNQKADHVASYLKREGVEPGALIAIASQRSIEMVVGILGILKAGCAYLPLDPQYPRERLSYMLTDSQAVLLLSDGTYTALKETSFQGKCIQLADILSKPRVHSEISSTAASALGLAYVIYTSGTTGKPKGVAVTHHSLVNHMLWMDSKFGFDEKDIFLQKTPFSFDASVWEFFAPLLCGAKLVMATNENPLEMSKLIKKHQVTVLQLVPSMLKQYLNDNEFHTCHSLQHVFSGGEALREETVALFFQKMPAKLHNLYGPTETTIQVVTHTYDKTEIRRMDAVRIGQPIWNVQVYVLDKYRNILPIGAQGELYIGGDCLAKGYLHQKELTEARFITHSFDNKTEIRLYKTGDKVSWTPEGILEYWGREDEQVKLRGFRIELGEIESILSQHEGIQDCAVKVHETLGLKSSVEREQYLVAYYVKKLALTNFDTENFIKGWETVYQSQYSALDINNFKQNTGGWNSSYTEKPIEQKNVLEWVSATIERINKLKPNTILEIGSGTGLVLFNMLENCHHYYATDFSKNVIEYTNQVVQKFGYTDKVSTLACTADTLPYEKLNYDTVVINSVVQYFPSLEYLESVLLKAISNIQGEGKIFIGDVRDFRLLKCFHASVQLYRRGKVSKSEIDYFSLRDKELLVAPEYFIQLKDRNVEISEVELLPKMGNADHEMNKYRYDVVLHIKKDEKIESLPVGKLRLTDAQFVKTLDMRGAISLHQPSEFLCIKYPNPRIAKDVIEYNKIYFNQLYLHSADYQNLLSVNQISELAEKNQFRAKFFIDVLDSFYLYIVFYKPERFKEENIFIEFSTLKQKKNVASTPLATVKLLENQFSNDLKEYLTSKLPSHMIPALYVPLEKIPLTVNGKIDKAALIEPTFSRSDTYVGPQTELEKQLCHIWAEILSLPEDKIGIQDDFFNLGGHSLSALRTLSLMENSFSMKFPIRTIFDHPTVEKLAKLIEQTDEKLTLNVEEDITTSPIISLQEEGFKAPLFLIHPIGGTIFWYKALSRYLGTQRSIYAIQDPGIDANKFLFKNIQQMANFYLKAIQEIQPSGPYLLAGASFGATVSIEIAHQLLKSGERVNFIGLLDGWPVYSKKFWEKDFFERLMLQQFQRMDSKFTSQGINDFEFLLKLQEHRMSMLRYYKIPLIQSKFTFFKAEELWPVFKEMVLPLDCWQPYSTQPVDTHIVPGNHETMFWEPNVQTLANKMNHAFSKFEIPKKERVLSFNLYGA